MAAQQEWQFWVDRGGTFTDVIGIDRGGRMISLKLLSEAPGRYDDAVLAGIEQILAKADPPAGASTQNSGPQNTTPLNRSTGNRSTGNASTHIGSTRIGTTVATNALLERTGARTALVITRGFGDALRIGYQNRPRIFDRRISLPEPLYERVIEVDERVDADGTVLRRLDEDRVLADLTAARDDGITAIAVACLHGHRFADHERRIARLADGLGFEQVSVSSAISPLIKLVSRADTTVVDAYLSPPLRGYVDSVDRRLGRSGLQFMQSNGGLVDASRFRAAEALLSGPAGGVVGMARMAEQAGFPRAIGFDMGGTSTDVAHYAGEFERTVDTTLAGVRVRTPMLDIHTVAAGGGSILHFDGRRLQVGPDSAGADPGPACYRNDGPLTITDANLLLGRIRADQLPSVFGPGGDQPVDVEIVGRRFDELTARITEATGERRSAYEVAAGYAAIAVQNMANAVKRISVHQGRDVTGYALIAFGGAGGQHACAVADTLGIRTVVVPPMASLLSAVGIGLADLTAIRQQSVERPLRPDLLGELDRISDRLAADGRDELAGSTGRDDRIETIRQTRLRYDGTDTALTVDRGTIEAMTSAFSDQHRRLYGFTLDRPLLVEALSVECRAASTTGDRLDWSATESAGTTLVPEAETTQQIWLTGGWQSARHVPRAEIVHTGAVPGPAVITEPDTSTVVEPGWTATLDDHHQLILRRTEAPSAPANRETCSGGAADITRADPVMLEIFNNLFMSVAEQMGAQLQSTSQSVNIKERLDFSCALFDPDGLLVANAPHIPVHLGSMGSSVREVIDRRTGSMRPGQMYAVNDPYHGGTHLPDITVIAPVFDQAEDKIIFYVASRGHHAEIGGITPGSMPAASRTLDQEGVLFDNWLLVGDGRFREQETRDLLASGPYPSRAPETNLADLRAQIAANRRGIDEIGGLIATYGLDRVQAYMRHVQDHADESVRRVIDDLADGSYRYQMDSGAVIKVAITVDHAERTATIDFTGSSPQLDSNFNAPSSVATAAVMYVFRTLVAADIPLNDGCLRPLHIVVEPGSMLAPQYPAAVVAGNVETSQAITGALYAALGVQAEGSGTMNNVTFGDDRRQYYETIASGSGAGDGFDGASAVQTHMTNSRLTDPEVLETRFPVLVEDFSIRRGSGGAGRWQGGDGVFRRLRFTEPMTVTVLSGHRRCPPYGMRGGQPGALGRNLVERADGSSEEVGSSGTVELAAGDVWVVETPGGGGWGAGTLHSPEADRKV